MSREGVQTHGAERQYTLPKGIQKDLARKAELEQIAIRNRNTGKHKDTSYTIYAAAPLVPVLAFAGPMAAHVFEMPAGAPSIVAAQNLLVDTRTQRTNGLEAITLPNPDTDPNWLRTIPKDAQRIGNSNFYKTYSISPEFGQMMFSYGQDHPNFKDSNRLGGLYGVVWEAKDGNKDKGIERVVTERGVFMPNAAANPKNVVVKSLAYAEIAANKVGDGKGFTNMPDTGIRDTMALVGSGGVTLKQLTEKDMVTFNGNGYTKEKPFVDTFIDINGNVQEGKTDGVVDVAYVGRENGHNVSGLTKTIREQYGEDYIRDLGLVISDGMFIRTKLMNPQTNQLEETWVFMQLCERGGITALLRTDPISKKQYWSPDTDLGGRMYAAIFLGTFEPQANPFPALPTTEPSPRPSASPSPSESPNPSCESKINIPRTESRVTNQHTLHGVIMAPPFDDKNLGNDFSYTSIDPNFPNTKGMHTRVVSVDQKNNVITVRIKDKNQNDINLIVRAQNVKVFRLEYREIASANGYYAYGANLCDLLPNDFLEVVVATQQEIDDAKNNSAPLNPIGLQGTQ